MEVISKFKKITVLRNLPRIIFTKHSTGWHYFFGNTGPKFVHLCLREDFTKFQPNRLLLICADREPKFQTEDKCPYISFLHLSPQRLILQHNEKETIRFDLKEEPSKMVIIISKAVNEENNLISACDSNACSTDFNVSSDGTRKKDV